MLWHGVTRLSKLAASKTAVVLAADLALNGEKVSAIDAARELPESGRGPRALQQNVMAVATLL